MSSSTSALNAMSGVMSNGLDVDAVVEQLLQVERAPERLMQSQQTLLQRQTSALKDIQSKLDALHAAVDALGDTMGAFNQVTAQSGDTSLYRVSVDAGAAIGAHTVVVNRLASVGSVHSRSMNSAGASFAAGTGFDVKIGDGTAVTVTFDSSHNTLSTAAEHINSLDLGVTATVISGANGAQLALTSQRSGESGQITITNDSTGLAMQQGIPGQNALVTIDGVEVESATNTVIDLVPGVTLNLISAAADRPTMLAVTRDTSAVAAAVQTYVTAYNSAMSAINAQFTYDQTSKSSGVLASDPSLRNLQQQLLTMATRAVDASGSITSLAQLGITMANDGSLSAKEGALSDALATSFTDVQKFFQAADVGFAVQADSELEDMTDTIDSPIAVDLKNIDATSRSISDAIAQFELRMADRQKQLTAQYTRIDVMMRQFSSTQQQVAAQLATLKTS